MIEIEEQVIEERITELEKERDQFQQNAVVQLNAELGKFAGMIHSLQWLLEQGVEAESEP